MVNYGPIIPCERRLAKMEIPVFQEVTLVPVLEIGTMGGLMDTFW